MNFSILLPRLSLNPHEHTHAFDEVADTLQSAFKALGYHAPIIHHPSHIQGTAIVLAPQLLYLLKCPLPENLILYNFEQLYEGCRWFNGHYRYDDLLKRYPIWDYSTQNIAVLNRMGIKDTVLCEYGYMPTLTRIPHADQQDIDVLLIGSPNKRRHALIEALKAKNLRVVHLTNLYGKERDAYIARAKVHLNVHLYNAHIFEIVRINYLLANHSCIVSEIGNDTALEHPYQNSLCFAKYDALVERCLQMVENPEMRESYANNGFEYIQTRTQTPMLENALKFVTHSPRIESGNPVITQSHPTIFIAIPSYLDAECIPTIERIFAHALHPERVFIGVCWQTNSAFGAFPWERVQQWASHIRVVEVDVLKSKGANWARDCALQLIAEETYTLLIDSHMWFVTHWDHYLIRQFQEVSDPAAVLTYYCPPYELPNRLAAEHHCHRRIIANQFSKGDDPQLIHLNRQVITKTDPHFGRRYPTPFIVHHFIFAASDVFRQIPIDPHIRFWGDEISLSTRLWTHGHTVYQLPSHPAYHQWNQRDENQSRTYRHINNPENKAVHHRVMSLLELLPTYARLALPPKYRLGNKRTLADFWEFAGLDVSNRKMHPHARNGMWNLSVLYRQKPRLADAPANATMQSSQETTSLSHKERVGAKARMIETTSLRIFIGIHASDARMLEASLQAMFTRARAPEHLRVAVAWSHAETYVLPASIAAYAHAIRIHRMHIKPQGSGLAKALSLWAQEPVMVLIGEGRQVVNDWDVTLNAALDTLPQAAVITQICANSHPPTAQEARDYTAPLIGVQPAHIHSELAISTIARTPETPLQERALLLTPLVSFDFIAGPAAIIMQVVPDPFLPVELQDIVYAARLHTHAVQAFQPNVQLLQPQAPKRAMPPPTTEAWTRAKHMLGLAYSDNEMALIDLDSYAHGEAGDVDTFWHNVGVNLSAGLIHPHALKGDWHNFATLNPQTIAQQMQPIGAMPSALAHTGSPAKTETATLRIFVQIASYRDTQCQYTVQDLFEKADHPERIFVGICWQTIPEEDEDCFRIITRPRQVRVVHFDARESKGACWARHEVQKLWQGEEFTLQIDSHMRFDKGWDTMLLAMHQQLDDAKSVLSTYPAGFTPPDHFSPRAAHKLVAREFTRDGIFTMNSKTINMQEHHKPVLGAFVSAGFLFAPASIIQEVPYDPHLYFFGEEISLSARLWTHGYTIFHPHKHIAWHDWKRDNRKSTHFKDHKDWNTMNRASFARVRYLLAGDIPEDAALKAYAMNELDRYGLGRTRTLEDYQTFSGVNFAERSYHDKAKTGSFEGMPERASHTPLTAAVAPPISRAAQAAGMRVEPYINPKKPMVIPKKAKLSLPKDEIIRNHGAIKTFESAEVVVYDDFLPEHLYEKLYEYTVNTDYKHINTSGNVTRVWNIDNGFPLRSSWNHYYEAVSGSKLPKDMLYPVKKPTDHFMEHVNATAGELGHLIGTAGQNWAHYSVTSWLYPPNTGLSLHNDGSGIYTGAYVYFMNKEWRLHWGGLLMVLDSTANKAMMDHRKEHNAYQFQREKWLHESEHNDYAMEAGFARTIFPKRNRIVFIAPDAYHIVTKILPTAGDNVRMTLAGFFNRGVLHKKQDAKTALNEYGD